MTALLSSLPLFLLPLLSLPKWTNSGNALCLRHDEGHGWYTCTSLYGTSCKVLICISNLQSLQRSFRADWARRSSQQQTAKNNIFQWCSNAPGHQNNGRPLNLDGWANTFRDTSALTLELGYRNILENSRTRPTGKPQLDQLFIESAPLNHLVNSVQGHYT